MLTENPSPNTSATTINKARTTAINDRKLSLDQRKFIFPLLFELKEHLTSDLCLGLSRHPIEGILNSDTQTYDFRISSNHKTEEELEIMANNIMEILKGR